jgi:hypothetical protein
LGKLRINSSNFSSFGESESESASGAYSLATRLPRKSQRQLLWHWWCECTCRILSGLTPFATLTEVPQVIVDSASSFCAGRDCQVVLPTPTSHRLLAFSANNADSLRRKVLGVQQYVEARPIALNDVAYTLGLRREHLTHRAFSVAGENAPLQISNFQKSRSTPPSLNFVFTGQGAQWPEMGKELLVASEGFRSDIRKMDRTLKGLKHAPSWSMEGMYFSSIPLVAFWFAYNAVV